MFLHTNSCRLCRPFAEHNAHEKKEKANTEPVVSSVIDVVHTEVNGCHYSVNTEVSQPNQQTSNSTSGQESREARS